MMEWSSTNNFYWYLLDMTACSRVIWRWMMMVLGVWAVTVA
jgi:hypothetical protein